MHAFQFLLLWLKYIQIFRLPQLVSCVPSTINILVPLLGYLFRVSKVCCCHCNLHHKYYVMHFDGYQCTEIKHVTLFLRYDSRYCVINLKGKKIKIYQQKTGSKHQAFWIHFIISNFRNLSMSLILRHSLTHAWDTFQSQFLEEILFLPLVSMIYQG